MKIILDVFEDADNVTLHLRDILVYENLVTITDLQTGENIPVFGHGYDSDREFYIVKTSLKATFRYVLDLPFLGNLNDDLVGFYRSTYQRYIHLSTFIKYNFGVKNKTK